MEEMELELPRAKKEVCERRRVVRVMAVGERSMRARKKERLDEMVWGLVGLRVTY